MNISLKIKQLVDYAINKKLITEAGRLNVPGRPIQYATTPDFLRTFGISSLEELPEIDLVDFGIPVQEEIKEGI